MKHIPHTTSMYKSSLFIPIYIKPPNTLRLLEYPEKVYVCSARELAVIYHYCVEAYIPVI